jgi:hypothetical protein
LQKVDGYFCCDGNYRRNIKLNSLKGCPKYVGGGFFCEHNNITSLKYGP